MQDALRDSITKNISRAVDTPIPNLWMKSRWFDLVFFHLSGLVVLLLLVPYVIMGPKVVFPIYNFYLVFFGLPHNYLTWATLLPATSRKHFNMEPVVGAAIFCAVICALLPFVAGTNLSVWILSFISYVSLWHAYRQHHGICKVYDSVQARRTGDNTIFADRKAMNVFFGLAANAVRVWAFTHEKVRYLLSQDEGYDLLHPVIPMNVYYLYMGATAAAGVWAAKRAVYDRWRAGRFIPWPQISLVIIAVLTYIVPYFFIPLEAMPLAMAIGTIYHNVQYFGFVWMFERHRSEELASTGAPLQLPQRLAFDGNWRKYFAIALAYSFLVIAVYLATPRSVGLTFIYFIGLAHYIIDGYIWRRDHNKLLGPVVARLAKA